jgi:hypothetical protein
MNFKEYFAMAYIKQSGLRLDQLSWYKEVGIQNGLGRTIYLLDSCDNIVEILPDGNGHNHESTSVGLQGNSDEYTFRIILTSRRIGELDSNGLPKAMSDNANREITTVEIKQKELKTTTGYKPIWIPLLGAVISLEANVPEMMKARPCSREKRESNSFEVDVNIHNPLVNHMYVVVFHKTIVANVTHDLQKDEGFSLRFTPVGGRPMVLRDKFSVDTDLACISNLFKNYGVVMGTDIDLVTATYHDLNTADLKKASKLESELNIAKEKCTSLAAENKILSDKLDTLINKEKEIRETENLRLKSEAAHADSIANMWKNITTIISAFSAIILLVLKFTDKASTTTKAISACGAATGGTCSVLLLLCLGLVFCLFIYKYKQCVIDTLTQCWNFLSDSVKKVGAAMVDVARKLTGTITRHVYTAQSTDRGKSEYHSGYGGQQICTRRFVYYINLKNRI